ncbi:hypothetical protein LOK74_04080 [Brevibacillus humidisoli]|uniref:hypothetical protein n=1 Tax=Brevibacillus humidisoli TaxID=2895522 RepID=UPI001E56F7EC|nr:hypothetical protein [Brevibacillus humidisoli]UFJ41702.1 hypothetical protein LOK74_04080 [Brevibacillus humidisoli]
MEQTDLPLYYNSLYGLVVSSLLIDLYTPLRELGQFPRYSYQAETMTSEGEESTK